MKKELVYKKGLIKLLENNSLDNISVISLCEEVGSNRHTFYYHFRDIYDVVNSIMLNSNIGFRDNINDLKQLLKSMHKYVEKEYSFLSKICKSGACEIVEDTFYRYFYKNIAPILKEKVTLIDDINTINRYISSLFSKEFLYYIISNLKESQTNFNQRLTIIWDFFVNKYLNVYKEIKL